MQKQLIQQISQAMQANADTIARQKDVIDYQEQSIERLKRLLTALAETQDKELKALPTMFATLETSLQENTKEQKVWRQSYETYAETQATLAEQLTSLVSVQLRLTTALDQYQSILVPADESVLDMRGLETMLKSASEQLKTSQSTIQESQEKISTELKRLATLLDK